MGERHARLAHCSVHNYLQDRSAGGVVGERSTERPCTCLRTFQDALTADDAAILLPDSEECESVQLDSYTFP